MGIDIRDCKNRICHQILPRNGGLTFILRQNLKFSYFSRETLSARGMRDVQRVFLKLCTLVALVPVNNH